MGIKPSTTASPQCSRSKLLLILNQSKPLPSQTQISGSGGLDWGGYDSAKSYRSQSPLETCFLDEGDYKILHWLKGEEWN